MLCLCKLLLIIIATTNIIIQPAQSFILNMTWKDTWSDIQNGGSKRWKVDDLNAKKIALGHILQHSSSKVEEGPLHILCPLAGDDPFVHYAWSQGHTVTAIDIVPDALAELRKKFGEDADWSLVLSESNSNTKKWQHKSGRATLLEGDMLQKRIELNKSFDAIYDKDSFGALGLDMRSSFVQRLSEYIKDDGTVYIEVKNKEQGRENGPPFHVEKSDLMDSNNFATCFEYVAGLGEVYPLKMSGIKQMGHIIRRVVRR